MAGGLVSRLKALLRSPQGRKLTQQAKRLASDPRNQQRAREAMNRLRKRR